MSLNGLIVVLSLVCDISLKLFKVATYYRPDMRGIIIFDKMSELQNCYIYIYIYKI